MKVTKQFFLRSFFFFFLSFLHVRAEKRGGRKDRRHAIAERYGALWTGFTRIWDLRAFSEWEQQSVLFVCCAGPYYAALHTRSSSLPSSLRNNRREYTRIRAIREIQHIVHVLSAYKWIICVDRRFRFREQNLHLQIDSISILLYSRITLKKIFWINKIGGTWKNSLFNKLRVDAYA